ncbi:MAG: hypothetical protein IH985_06175 [Planctomycetes bacterium]|nr:hypothetical protein [Planctomycetota bacterium]
MQDFKVAGIELNGVAEAGQGLIVSLHAQEGDAPPVKYVGVIGARLQALAVVGHCRFVSPQVAYGVSRDVQGNRVVGLDLRLLGWNAMVQTSSRPLGRGAGLQRLFDVHRRNAHAANHRGEHSQDAESQYPNPGPEDDEDTSAEAHT